MRIVYTIFLTLVVILSLLFAVSNSEQVNIHYYFGNATVPLSLALAIAVVIGCILGMLGCLKVILRTKYNLRSVKQEMNLAKKEIANMRAIPIKDSH